MNKRAVAFQNCRRTYLALIAELLLPIPLGFAGLLVTWVDFLRVISGVSSCIVNVARKIYVTAPNRRGCI